MKLIGVVRWLSKYRKEQKSKERATGRTEAAVRSAIVLMPPEAGAAFSFVAFG